MTITPIAYIVSPFREKFGIPRQSRLAAECPARIEFAPGYAMEDAVRGLEEFSHIWLIWGFSQARWDGNFTVRPPRLGGNTRIGVFASRSPFRPNSIGISAVRLERIEITADRGPVLHVSGADLLDGTPIYDIKPYIPYADCILEASDGYTAPTKDHRLKVEFAPGTVSEEDFCKEGTNGHQVINTSASSPDGPPTADEIRQIAQILSLDPRVSYDSDPEKVWGMAYGRWNIRFTVAGGIARIVSISAI